MDKQLEKEKELAADKAVIWIKEGYIVGLGTGSSAEYVIRFLGHLIKEGMVRIKGAVSTSIRTEKLAASLGIPLLDINEVDEIDLTIDGADEFTNDLQLIKGGGGALFREKIVASKSRELFIVADSSKAVKKLGKFRLPIEVAPFASSYVLKQLMILGGKGDVRMNEGTPYITDQDNYVLDTDFGLIEDPKKLSFELNQIEGIVCHGLFINLASRVIVGTGDRVLELKK